MGRKMKVPLSDMTFEAMAREWHEHHSHYWTVSHAKRKLSLLERDVFPFIGKKSVTAITASEVRSVLFLAERRSLYIAHELLSICNQVLDRAFYSRFTEYNPVRDLRGTLPRLRRINSYYSTNPEEVALLLRAIDHYPNSIVMKCALQLSLLLGARPAELRKAEWPEIDFATQQWVIPAGRNRKPPIIVPLSSQALTILRKLYSVTGNGRHVFPGHRSSDRCISDKAVNAALRSMGFELISGRVLRKMVLFILYNALRIRDNLIAFQFGYTVKPQVFRRPEFAEQQNMMQVLADYLDGLKQGDRCTGTGTTVSGGRGL